MSNYATGHEAEQQAAVYLKEQGFRIIAINWRTPRCEIDIVAEKAGTVHFIEVKHRKNHNQGSGFDYITARKQQRMRFAAEVWVQEHGWTDEYCLGAIELSGNDYLVEQFLEEI